MNLQARLDERKQTFESSAPPEALQVMHRATQDLIDSNIMDGVLKQNDEIPHFSLRNQHGTLVRSEDLLKNGPLVIGFYRGVW